MFENTMIPAMALISYNRRILIVTIFLSSMAFLLVATSIAAFVYVTRKERVLRRYHLVSVIVIILIELAFLIAVVSCFSIQSKNTHGQVFAVLLIILSFLALMTLIYFLLEDLLRERIEPIPEPTLPSKSHTFQEIRTISRHDSPITPPPMPEAEPSVIPIATPPVLTPVPRIPTPPPVPSSPPPSSPPPDLGPDFGTDIPPPSSPIPPPVSSPSPRTSPGELIVSPQEPLKTPSPRPTPPAPPPSVYMLTFDKIRQDLLAAIEERTIPALESAIQQVKDHDVIHQLKYECERALELLNRLMKIETMKIKVLRLNQSTIAELHSYIKPPEEVSTVMRATFLLLGHSEKEIQEWPQIQNLLGRFGKDSVRRRCYELNPLAIPVDKAREAKDILRNYDLIRVSEISVGLSAFYCWASAMIDEREKLLESQRRIYR